jgi:hypothetical protein
MVAELSAIRNHADALGSRNRSEFQAESQTVFGLFASNRTAAGVAA